MKYKYINVRGILFIKNNGNYKEEYCITQRLIFEFNDKLRHWKYESE